MPPQVSGAEEGVIIVTGNSVGRPGGKGNIHTRYGGRCFRHEPLLDLARNYQITFHRDAVGQLQNKQQEQRKCTEDA